MGRGGARPGSGAKPKEGGAKQPVQERVAPLLAAYCRQQQELSPGYLARLIQADLQRAVVDSPAPLMLP